MNFLCRLKDLKGIMKRVLVSLLTLLFYFQVSAQQYPVLTPAQKLVIRTGEDSLSAGIAKNKTIVSGYGSAFYQRDFNKGVSTATLERAVFFIGHQFNSKITFFSETEIENAKVEGGEPGGEIALEQAYLQFRFSNSTYLVAGLFIPRIGMLNENHLPVNFNGVERPMVETFIIPATWRELGVGLYGTIPGRPLNYSIGLMNGLSSQNFEHGSGFREGRAEGSFAPANNLAVTGALQYFVSDFRFQVSGYMGGTVGLSQKGADSLGLNSGGFGTPLYLGEASMQYSRGGFSAKAIGTYVSMPDAYKVNKAYSNNVFENMYGAYAELAYNFFENIHNKKLEEQEFVAFARYEMLDMNSKIPKNGIYDGTLKQQHLIVGLSYLPIRNIIIKTDVRLLHTGPQNPELNPNPNPVAAPYQQHNSFFNLGIGYSF